MASYTQLPAPVQNLIDEFNRLPGIGPKTAARLVFYLLRVSAQRSESLSGAIVELRAKIRFCDTCYNIAEAATCNICASPKRERSLLCVVSDPLDIVALEKTHDYRGLYHVLHGEISPINGVGPDNLRITELESRLADGEVKELILATNPTMEGETTAIYIAKLLHAKALTITRLARGLPVGGDLEYADEVTLGNALTHRRAFVVG